MINRSFKIILSKSDLVTEDEIKDKIKILGKNVIPISALVDESLEPLYNAIKEMMEYQIEED